jgi:uncharacterized membrane protein YeiB
MGSAMRTAHKVRLASILAVGAFVLHELRYLIAFGGSANAELAQAGHSYMSDLSAPVSVLALAAVLATLIRGTEAASPTRAPLGRRMAIFAGALLAIYVGQELLEGLLATGHATGFAGVIGGGGWIALPLALTIGTLAALLAHVLERVERVIAVIHTERRLRPRAPAVRGSALPARGLSLLSAPLAFGLARRPPPPAPSQ